VLGIEVNNGILAFEKFEIFFGDELGAKDFQLVIETQKDLSQIEELLIQKGGEIISSGFDISGPYLIVKDPSGLRIRIGDSSAWIKGDEM
jgi:hypothetical protein